MVRCDSQLNDVFVVTILIFLNINASGELDTIQIAKAVDTAP